VGVCGVFACHFGAATTHKEATWRKVCLRVCACVCVWLVFAARTPALQHYGSATPGFPRSSSDWLAGCLANAAYT